MARKHPVATGLNSKQLALLDREVKERALFSARTTEQRYLASMQDVLTDMVAGKISEGEARKRLLGILDDFGYTPEHGFPDAEKVDPAKTGAITDLSSYGRINLILDVNEGMASSVSRLSEENDATLALFPAWRFMRFINPNGEPRDWQLRWAVAGDAVGWIGACRGEMVARKDSPIWQALGDGEGGFSDTLGNPYPPFAFNSGMGWEDVDREEARSLGLDVDEPVMLERPSLAVNEDELNRAREHYGDNFADTMKEIIGLTLSNAITDPCPICHHQRRADGGCTHCERKALLDGGLRLLSRSEVYMLLEQPVVVRNGGTTFRFTREKLLSANAHIRRDRTQSDFRRRVRVLLYGINAAKTSKDIRNKLSTKPNELGVYPHRKEITKTYTDKNSGKPFKVVVLADDSGNVYDVFDLYPA